MSAMLDIGPLTWVKSEIDSSLDRAHAALRAFAEDTQRAAELKSCRASLHQAAGAVQIVGLEGVSRFFEETERVVGDLESGRLEPSPAAIEALERAIAAIAKYLSELIDGAADQPLRLLPEFRALAKARRAPEPSAAELFFPNLTLADPPRDKLNVRLPREQTEYLLRTQRTRFQRALVRWLREPLDVPALEEMRAAVDLVEETQSLTAQRTFWWTVAALFDALAQGDLGADPALRQLCSRVEQQLRRLTDGSPSVAERLHREVLYWISKAGAASERARVVRRAFALDGEPERTSPADLSQRLVIARGLREAIGGAKEAWSKFAAGSETALATFVEMARGIAERGRRLASAEFGALTAEVERAALELQAGPEKMSEPIAMEMATALLVVENAAGNYQRLPGLARQLGTMLARLRAALAGAAEAMPTEPLLDEMTRRAQDRLALGSALAEMRANLQRIERELDAYFRDPIKGIELSSLEPLVHQVSGALDMLGERDARSALERAAEKIRAFAAAPGRAPLDEFEEVADILSGLSFYIEALRHGKADFAAIMRPARVAAARAAPSVEAELKRAKRDAQAALEAWQQNPLEPQLAAELKNRLEAIRADSELLADQSLGEQAQRALAQLDATGSPELARQLGRALANLAPRAQPSAQARRLSQASDQVIDRELLEIFLEETDGVLASIRESLAQCRDAPGSIAHLTAVRRAFHTLKGSGRMVGLSRLAEAAWAVERVMNLWLQEERGATPDLLALIEMAHTGFADWVRRLRGGEPQPDAAPLIAAAERVTRGEPLADSGAQGAAAASAPDEEPVSIGTLRVTRSLYAVFVGEARQLLDAIERELAASAAASETREELLRATHTLAGICGTLQIDAMQALGHAMEEALLRLRATAALGADAHARLVEGVAALRAMYEEVLERRAPGPRADLIDALRTLAPKTLPPDSQAVPEHAPPPAPAVEEIAVERRHQRLADEIDPQLLPAFLEEAQELVPRLAELLRNWRAEAFQFEHAKALQRVLHTLKGSARMAGAMGLGELVHQMETRVESACAQKRVPTQLFDALEQACDRVAVLLERLHKRDQAPPVAPPKRPAQEPPKEPVPSRALLRVRADMLEKLVNEAGEVAIVRARIEGEMRGFKQALGELTENVVRLRQQLREIEIQAESQMQARVREAEERSLQFDPLEFDRFTRFQELTRMMAESVNDVATVQQNLARTLEGSESALSAQNRLNRELQQDLMRIRMVPVGTLAERLHRLVRQVSKELGKRASLDLRGAEVELDRAVLERLTGPLEHLLRNSLTHGIEPPAERAARGKPEIGEIRLEVRQEGNEIALTLSDDGGGLDLERIRARGLAQGLLAPGDPVDEQRLAELIFEPGLSTAEHVSEVAGRGVGLDVVKNEVSGLGGRIELEPGPGRGARFAIRLPLTTAITQAVLARAAGRTYAVPAVMVERVQQLRADQLVKVRAAGHVESGGRRYPLAYLPALMGEASAPAQERRSLSLLLLRAGADSVALLVDEMLGNQEVVVKNLGPQLARAPGVAGVTVLGGGEIVLIVNPVPLAKRPLPPIAGGQGPAAVPAATRPRVMVVDDSLTVRKITGRLLTREGYQVLTAKDGVEALEQLVEALPDVMLVDIEMPRMDGFDLTRNVRADARLRKVPIIMITSRTADKHRRHALELGVDVFLGKPYREDELLGHVASFASR
jgi:chemosensory pili system protein ChpA (sensor histidine kinase/response regulator)